MKHPLCENCVFAGMLDEIRGVFVCPDRALHLYSSLKFTNEGPRISIASGPGDRKSRSLIYFRSIIADRADWLAALELCVGAGLIDKCAADEALHGDAVESA